MKDDKAREALARAREATEWGEPMKFLLFMYHPVTGWTSQFFATREKAKAAAELAEKMGTEFAALIDLEAYREESKHPFYNGEAL